MKRYTFLLSILIGVILSACGGGGGGGGGTGDDGAKTIHSTDYLSRDKTKTYTYSETEEDTYGGKHSSQTSTLVYSYASESVDAIPSRYNYPGTVAGPYYVETLTINDIPSTISYESHSGATVISDNFSTFTSNDPDHTTLSGNIPVDWIVGKQYSLSNVEDLLNSDPDQGTIGEKLGSKTTEFSIKALGIESVTIAAGTYYALKTESASTCQIILDNQTKTITTSAASWYAEGIGLVKNVANSTIVYPDGTVTSTVTDELTGVSP